MNRRQRRIFGVVVALLVVAFIGYQIRSRRRQAAAEQLRMEQEQQQKLLELQAASAPVEYVAPTVAIPARTTITDRMVELKSVPKKYAPWTDEEDARNYPKSIDKVVGRIALVDLAQAEPLRKERLASRDDLRAISFLIEPGKRALTIRMNLEDAVGGFIRQGDYVDILGTFTLPSGTITKAILKRVKILIVDKTYIRAPSAVPDDEDEEEDGDEAEEEKDTGGVPGNPTQAYNNLGMVTFEVTPEEAEKLVLAADKLNLTFALRNPGELIEEGDEDDIEYVLQADVLGIGGEDLPPEEPVGEVELILGAQKETKTVGVQ